MIFCKLLPVYQFVSPTTHAIFINCQPIFLIKAYELSVLTGTQVLLLVVSETGLVYTFTTPKLQPLVTKAEGKNLIQVRTRQIPVYPASHCVLLTTNPSRRV